MLIIPIPKPLQVNGGAQFRRVMAEAGAVPSFEAFGGP